MSTTTTRERRRGPSSPVPVRDGGDTAGWGTWPRLGLASCLAPRSVARLVDTSTPKPRAVRDQPETVLNGPSRPPPSHAKREHLQGQRGVFRWDVWPARHHETGRITGRTASHEFAQFDCPSLADHRLRRGAAEAMLGLARVHQTAAAVIGTGESASSSGPSQVRTHLRESPDTAPSRTCLFRASTVYRSACATTRDAQTRGRPGRSARRRS